VGGCLRRGQTVKETMIAVVITLIQAAREQLVDVHSTAAGVAPVYPFTTSSSLPGALCAIESGYSISNISSGSDGGGRALLRKAKESLPRYVGRSPETSPEISPHRVQNPRRKSRSGQRKYRIAVSKVLR